MRTKILNFDTTLLCRYCKFKEQCDKTADEALEDGNTYFHCCGESLEFTDEVISHRLLSQWLAKGFGEIKEKNGMQIRAYLYSGYYTGNERIPVDSYLVRKWDTDEWHLPTADYCLPSLFPKEEVK